MPPDDLTSSGGQARKFLLNRGVVQMDIGHLSLILDAEALAKRYLFQPLFFRVVVRLAELLVGFQFQTTAEAGVPLQARAGRSDSWQESWSSDKKC